MALSVNNMITASNQQTPQYNFLEVWMSVIAYTTWTSKSTTSRTVTAEIDITNQDTMLDIAGHTVSSSSSNSSLMSAYAKSPPIANAYKSKESIVTTTGESLTINGFTIENYKSYKISNTGAGTSNYYYRKAYISALIKSGSLYTVKESGVTYLRGLPNTTPVLGYSYLSSSAGGVASIENSLMLNFNRPFDVADLRDMTGVRVLYNGLFTCPTLEAVYLPNSLNCVFTGAFIGCPSLSVIDFGSGVTNFYGYVFYSASLTSLTDIYLRSDAVVSCSSAPFSGSPRSDLKIHVPENLLEDYQTASYWSSYASNFVAI